MLLSECFYVDDLIGGEEDLQAVLKTTSENVKVDKDGNILCKWKTQILWNFESCGKFGIDEERNLTSGIEFSSKVLGLVWDPDANHNSFNVINSQNSWKIEQVQKELFLD